MAHQLQATSSQDQEPLDSPSLSEYLPFFHTHEQTLAMEELAQQGEVCSGHKASLSSRDRLFLEDLAPPSGFFPYYRSQEEHLSTIPHGCWCLGTRDCFPGSVAQDGCCKVTSVDRYPSALAGPDLLSGFAPLPACCHLLGGLMCDDDQHLALSGDPILDTSGFVPYYRSPEERLHTSPVPASSGLESSRE